MWFLNMIFLCIRKGHHPILLPAIIACTLYRGSLIYTIFHHFRCKSGISFHQVGIMFTDFLWLNVFSALLKLLALRVLVTDCLVSCTYFVGLCGCALLPNHNKKHVVNCINHLHISNTAPVLFQSEEELLNRMPM